MRLAEPFKALRAWCKQCLSGPLKPDMLRPGIVGMRGSNSYGHTTTAMHKLSNPPHPPPDSLPSAPPPPRLPPPPHFSLVERVADVLCVKDRERRAWLA